MMKTFLRALVIAAAVSWVYAPCLHGTWLWDDGLEITQNAALRSPAGWWQPWIHPQGLDYFPLKSTLQWVEWHFWGANPLGYHVVSVALHFLSALLIWRLLRLLGVRAAMVGGLLFAVHPLAVESVAWISEFKNTASLPPLLLAAIAYVRYDRQGRAGLLVASVLWFLAALACKTSVVMLPAFLLLYTWWRRGRVGRRDLTALAPLFAAAAALGAVTVWFQSTRAIGIAGAPGTWVSRLAQAGWSIAEYTRMSVWPVGLAPNYSAHALDWTAVLPWAVILAVLALFWNRRRGWGRHALLGTGWFLLNLVPVLGLIPMAYFRVGPRADHFAYLPLAGWTGLVAAAFSAGLGAWERRRGDRRFVQLPFVLLALAAAAALGFGARAYAGAYRDPKALWTFAVQQNPRAWLARTNLGKVLYEERNFPEAEVQFREAAELQPDSPETHADLANTLEALGHPDEAREEYASALRLNPRFAGAHYDLGLSLLRAGRAAEAAAEFRAALELDPQHAPARNSLGLALAALGRPAESMEQYRLAVQADPTLPEAHLNLGNALFREGKTNAAAGEYREALRLDPGYSGAHHNLGAALERLGRPAEAAAEFEAARRTANH